MKRSLLLVIIIINIVFVSCITNKDVVYLQDKGGGMDSLTVINEIQKPYRVQVNDILSINVKALDEELTKIFNPVESSAGAIQNQSQSSLYFNGFTVDLHGRIKFPILGEITVLGFTVKEIEALVKEELLKQYFKETAELFVTVKLAGLRYTVTGEVGGAGVYTLFQDRVNIIEALANAGDILVTGNRKDVLVIRQYPDGQKIHHIDLTDKKAMQSSFYYIQPNDMILVKPLKRKSIGAGQTAVQNLAAISSILAGLVSIYVLTRNL
ncbi:polysaccharide biosynthesis/export family protein [Tamlana sp. 2201CG12-4]|uniref:polysaccharide biosynthesis/export family protein n=1 Tax=Tamlana sp. 2201CG12-4 TaxID=3112582 RepID=UPI002DBD2739|nr:polysaccharide biosynthesis/export family protein [Tamlana sp. 2201CG12-4]MEC3907328.1 polysaccharide biosynthesis/export family protein [Tamlana sp. 2201CG12-4]